MVRLGHGVEVELGAGAGSPPASPEMKATPMPLGVRFSETGCGFDYLSTNKHQHGQLPKGPIDHSSWCIEREEEASAFCRSVLGAGREDQQGNYWYTERDGNKLRRLGTADEKLALFQAPSNEIDGWHGHPRGHRGRSDYPDTQILRELKDAGVINNVEYRRVIAGEIP
jgi:hypothetical protein